jgi:chaperonin cofactor prefoldin
MTALVRYRGNVYYQVGSITYTTTRTKNIKKLNSSVKRVQLHWWVMW